MSHNIWDETLLQARLIYAVKSSYRAMKGCIFKGDVDGLKKILSDIHKDRKLDDNTYQGLMQTAAKRGSVACFEYLQAYVAEPTVYSDALNSAAENNHLQIVRHIAPLIDEYSREDALARAALYNRADVVRYLLTVCNPQHQSSKCLAAAASEGHSELFELLYPLCNPSDALNYLKRKFENQPHTWEMLEQRILRDKLLAATPQDRSNKRSKI